MRDCNFHAVRADKYIESVKSKNMLTCTKADTLMLIHLMSTHEFVLFWRAGSVLLGYTTWEKSQSSISFTIHLLFFNFLYSN
jgi:hypothetical protein